MECMEIRRRRFNYLLSRRAIEGEVMTAKPKLSGGKARKRSSVEIGHAVQKTHAPFKPSAAWSAASSCWPSRCAKKQKSCCMYLWNTLKTNAFQLMYFWFNVDHLPKTEKVEKMPTPIVNSAMDCNPCIIMRSLLGFTNDIIVWIYERSPEPGHRNCRLALDYVF